MRIASTLYPYRSDSLADWIVTKTKPILTWIFSLRVCFYRAWNLPQAIAHGTAQTARISHRARGAILHETIVRRRSVSPPTAHYSSRSEGMLQTDLNLLFVRNIYTIYFSLVIFFWTTKCKWKLATLDWLPIVPKMIAKRHCAARRTTSRPRF